LKKKKVKTIEKESNKLRKDRIGIFIIYVFISLGSLRSRVGWIQEPGAQRREKINHNWR